MTDSQPVYIFHITHVKNLQTLITDEHLWSDREVSQRRTSRVVIGYDHIKERRLNELTVLCHPGTMVGDFVPFYFCPRSPMLYKISRQDGSLTYTGGQEAIVHLVSTVDRAIDSAEDRPWAFSDGNAGAHYTQFSKDLDQLDSFVDWDSVNSKWWSGPQVDPAVRSKKMAEFLIYERFPWNAIGGIGVMTPSVRDQVLEIIADCGHKPQVAVKKEWYY